MGRLMRKGSVLKGGNPCVLHCLDASVEGIATEQLLIALLNRLVAARCGQELS